MSSFRTALCKGCGKPVVWGVTKAGKRVPLDPRAHVYRVVGAGVARAERAVNREGDGDVPIGYMVLHAHKGTL